MRFFAVGCAHEAKPASHLRRCRLGDARASESRCGSLRINASPISSPPPPTSAERSQASTARFARALVAIARELVEKEWRLVPESGSSPVGDPAVSSVEAGHASVNRNERAGEYDEARDSSCRHLCELFRTPVPTRCTAPGSRRDESIAPASSPFTLMPRGPSPLPARAPQWRDHVPARQRQPDRCPAGRPRWTKRDQSTRRPAGSRQGLAWHDGAEDMSWKESVHAASVTSRAPPSRMSPAEMTGRLAFPSGLGAGDQVGRGCPSPGATATASEAPRSSAAWRGRVRRGPRAPLARPQRSVLGPLFGPTWSPRRRRGTAAGRDRG